jgi:hypothetical protein
MLCQDTARFSAASRFYRDAFAHDARLADDLKVRHRYNAACAAALAGCRRGKDAENLSDEEQTRLRHQALAWLRADLKFWGQQLDKDFVKARGPVSQTMRHWQSDIDFAGVRGPEAQGRLPEGERQDWQKLWEEIELLRQRATGTQKPASPEQP